MHKALVGFLALHKSGLVSHDKFHPRLEGWKEDQKFNVILGYHSDIKVINLDYKKLSQTTSPTTTLTLTHSGPLPPGRFCF